jgi:hypothetical protein
MIALILTMSVAIRRYLRTYMPSNIAIDLLRSRRGLKWAVPVAGRAVPAYLFAAALAASAVDRGGPGWLSVLVILFFWNAAKFAWLIVLTPVSLILAGWRADTSASRVSV